MAVAKATAPDGLSSSSSWPRATRLLASARLERWRDGMEDYEYLWLANGGHPQVGASEPVDQTAGSVASSLTSWTKNADALMTLSLLIGMPFEPMLLVDLVFDAHGSDGDFDKGVARNDLGVVAFS